MAQQVQRGDEVTPLDQLTQWSTTEGIFCYFKARLFGQQTQVHQDLTEKETIMEIIIGYQAGIFQGNAACNVKNFVLSMWEQQESACK